MKYISIYLPVVWLLFCGMSRAAAQQSAVTYKDGRYYIADSIVEQCRNFPALLDILEWQRLTASVRSRDVPKPIRKFYRDIREERWQMADTGGAYNCCCDVDEKLPSRQLIYLGYNDNMVLMSYRHGMGVFGAVMVAIFRLEQGRITDFWSGSLLGFDGEPDSQKVMVQQLREMMKDKAFAGDVLDL